MKTLEISFIDLDIAADNLGENTDADNEAYRSAVERELQRQYPDTVITVNLADTNVSSVEVLPTGWVHSSPHYWPEDIRDLADEVADQVREIEHRIFADSSY